MTYKNLVKLKPGQLRQDNIGIYLVIAVYGNRVKVFDLLTKQIDPAWDVPLCEQDLCLTQV